MTAENLCKRYEALKARRANWESHWQQIAEVIAPRFSDMLGSRTEGDKRMTRVYDSTGIAMNELLASGLHGIATNPATRWFGLRVIDEKLMEMESVKEYLSDTETEMFREMHAPNAALSTHLHESYMDCGAFGTAVMFIGDIGGRPSFQTRHLKECFLDENADGDVDTVFRCFWMTARQLWQMSEREENPWTLPKAVSETIAADKWDQTFEVVHAVHPREELKRGKRTRDNLPFASIYVFRQDKTILDEGGFEEFPYAILMWNKNPGEVYGRGPGMTALPDVQMLQEMMKVHIRAGQKLVDPPLMVSDDSVLGPIRTMPGGLNFLRPGSDIRPLQTGARLDLSFEMMQDVRNRIGQIFFADVVRPFTERTNETATEVMQRVQQQMRLLGPVLGRLEKYLGQIVARVYGIMFRAGKLPDPPEELLGRPFTVEFVSPIATAQRAGEVETVSQWLALNAQAMQVAPEVSDRIDWAQLPEWTADRLRVDPDLVLDDEEAAAKAQQRQMAQAMAAAQPVAAAAKDGATALQTLRGAA